MDKAEKIKLKEEREESRQGKLIICKRCKIPGGTLTKAGPGVYVHPTCPGRKADGDNGDAAGRSRRVRRHLSRVVSED